MKNTRKKTPVKSSKPKSRVGGTKLAKKSFFKPWMAIPAVALVAVAGYFIVSISQASTYRTNFMDISSPQCGDFTRRLGKSKFGIVGLNGTYMNFGTNKCLREQVGKFYSYDLYVGANYPSGECLKRGKTSAYECGKEAGRHNLYLIKAYGLRPGGIWIDVESGPNVRWTRSQKENRDFIAGLYNMMRTGYTRVGYYSTPNMWNAITGGANIGGSGNWIASGRDNPTAAKGYCGKTFGGKSNVYTQWVWGGRLDMNIACR